MSLSSTEFEFLAKLLKDRSGLSLTQDKMYLLESRLLPVIREHDIVDLPTLVSRAKIHG